MAEEDKCLPFRLLTRLCILSDWDALRVTERGLQGFVAKWNITDLPVYSCMTSPHRCCRINRTQ